MKFILYSKQKEIKRPVPENFHSADNRYFDGAFHNVIREIHYREISSGVILHTFLFQGFRLLRDYCLSLGMTQKKINKLYLKRLIYPVQSVKEGFWILDNWSVGYFHWLTDALPRLLVIKRSGTDAPVLLPDTFRNIKYVTESLTLLNCRVFWYSPRINLKVSKLMTASRLQPCGYDPELICDLRHQLIDDINHSSDKAGKRIYITRKRAQRRRVLNEREIETLLQEFGFETIEMEKLSFYEQRLLMQQASFLISNHGAGLTNMLFMKSNSTIIELMADSANVNNCFFNLARALNYKYYYTINPSTSENVQVADITVRIDHLRNLLQNIEF